MCGISGVVSFNNNSLTNSLPDLLDAIKHRGPDDEGYAFFSNENYLTAYGEDTPINVKNSNLPYAPKSNLIEIKENHFLGLGHRRLSILDLSEKGHQPMCDTTKNYWIVYNGEIYNYKEIKNELIKLGYEFISQSDTEVLLYAYIEWGEKCLDKLNGMWSFVIYDRKKNELFGARDRFGVKPFYFINNKDYFSFSSEIKSLIKIPYFKKEINPKAVYDYLVLGKLEIGDESFIKNIIELKPAHYFRLNINNSSFEIKRYYQLEYTKKWESFNANQLKDYTTNIYNKLSKAINIRLNADVKTGTCLSGGIDSSIVSCVINEKDANEKQELFTAIYPNSDINEEKWAEIVANSTKSKWNKTAPNAEQLKEQLEDLIYYQDIPFTSSSSYSQYKVMELVAESSVKVTLDGQGADELFGGYSTHFASSIHNSIKKLALGTFFNNITSEKSNFSSRSLVFLLPLKYLFSKFFNSSYQNQIIKSQPELAYINHNLWQEYNSRFNLKNDDFNSNLNQLLAYQFDQHKLKHMLRLADRNSMRFSIESRMPFADDINLIEYVFNVSGSYKIRNGKSKFLLREATKNILPEEIYNRKDKIGFATPESEWFKELKPYFKEIIFEQKPDEFLDWKGIQDNFDNIYNNALTSGTQRLWRLINFAIWRKVYEI